MIDNTIQNYSQAVQLIAQATSARAKGIIRLRSYVYGDQYAGRPNYFTDTVPLWEREPCIVYNVAEDAINQKVDLVLGEDRYPAITARSVWGNDNKTIDEAQSSEIDQCLAAIESEANLKVRFAEVLEEASGCSSAAILCGIRDNCLFVETFQPEWCTPTLARNGECLRLDVMYGYIDIVQERTLWKAIPMMYRRVITDQQDITYLPVEIRAGFLIENYSWVPQETINHGLGFCPVRWYRYMNKCNVAGRIDGYAIHRNDMDEMDALNFSLSQRHRAAIYSGDPQWTETGVSPGEGPGAKGRPAKVLHPSSPFGGPPSEINAPHQGGYVSMGTRSNGKARKKGPGEVWSYTNPETKVVLHTLPGDALDALDKNSKDILSKLEAKFGVVSLDPEKLPKGNALAASSMKKLMRRMFASCDRIRSDFGDNFIGPAYAMLLRIAVGTNLELPGIEGVRKLIEDMGDRWNWNSPPFELSWGPYQDPDPEEESAIVQTVIALQSSGLCTDKVAVTMLKSVMRIENVDVYLKELEKSREEKANKEREANELTANSDHARQMEMVQTQAALKPKPPKAGKQ